MKLAALAAAAILAAAPASAGLADQYQQGEREKAAKEELCWNIRAKGTFGNYRGGYRAFGVGASMVSVLGEGNMVTTWIDWIGERQVCRMSVFPGNFHQQTTVTLYSGRQEFYQYTVEGGNLIRYSQEVGTDYVHRSQVALGRTALRNEIAERCSRSLYPQKCTTNAIKGTSL